jgi:hypothetical protein
LLDELLNGVVHDVASDEPRITPLAYMIIRDATPKNCSDDVLMSKVVTLALRNGVNSARIQSFLEAGNDLGLMDSINHTSR